MPNIENLTVAWWNSGSFIDHVFMEHVVFVDKIVHPDGDEYTQLMHSTDLTPPTLLPCAPFIFNALQRFEPPRAVPNNHWVLFLCQTPPRSDFDNRNNGSIAPYKAWAQMGFGPAQRITTELCEPIPRVDGEGTTRAEQRFSAFLAERKALSGILRVVPV